MASLPPQQPAPQRRSSSSRSPDETTSSEHPASLSPEISTTSEDSQTVLLSGHSAPVQASYTKSVQTEDNDPFDENDPKKCWICMCDETEDTPLTSKWRSPCPCALRAHEDCLLEWISDMEAPSGARTTVANSKVECPQCKNPITVDRPRSLVVQGLNGLEKLALRSLIPTALIFTAETVERVLAWHGEWTIVTLFGAQDANTILQPLDYGKLLRHEWWNIGPSILHKVYHWQLFVGLPLIPVSLVLSRITLADSFLPVLPIVLLATHPDASERLDWRQWPPSPTLVFSMLPYIRGIYNVYLKKVWGKRELEWSKIVQPNHNQGNGGDGEENPNGPNEADEENMIVQDEMVIELDVGPGEPDEDLAAPPDIQDNRPQANAMPADQGPQPGLAPQERAQNAPRPRNPQRRITLSALSLGETVIGALAFPAVASTAGELLKLLLPTAWTVSPVTSLGVRRPTGLLQQKWGRSVIGGCLFVVLKDALMLYVRWRQARDHRMRKVLDWQEAVSKGKVKARKT